MFVSLSQVVCVQERVFHGTVNLNQALILISELFSTTLRIARLYVNQKQKQMLRISNRACSCTVVHL
jgi:hypothetical protein